MATYRCTYSCVWTDEFGIERTYTKVTTSDHPCPVMQRGAPDLGPDNLGFPVMCYLVKQEPEPEPRFPVLVQQDPEAPPPSGEPMLYITGDQGTRKVPLSQWLREIEMFERVVEYLKERGLIRQPEIGPAPRPGPKPQ